jgi:hypothetical protein
MEDLVNQQARSTSDPPEPSRPDHPASFFFLGALQPAEQANFNLQNIVLPGEDAVLEVFGHGVAGWWRQRVRSDFEDVRDATRDWLETIVAIYYLCSGTALDVHLAHWVETLANVEEAVVGFIDSRFRIITVPPEDSAGSAVLRRSVQIGAELRQRKHVLPAAKEAWRSGLDPSDEAFLSAFRALECLRRVYGEGEEERKAAWDAMRQDLGFEPEPHGVLREAALAVRHGDRPATRSEIHPVNAARSRRSELLRYATDLVRRKVSRDLGVDLTLPSTCVA